MRISTRQGLANVALAVSAARFDHLQVQFDQLSKSFERSVEQRARDVFKLAFCEALIGSFDNVLMTSS